LGKFLGTDDGKSRSPAQARVNILRIEEKKDARQYHGKLTRNCISSPRSANSRSAS